MKVSKCRQWGIQAYWLLAVLYWEILTHAGMYGQFHSSFLYALAFSAAAALLLGTLIGFLPEKAVLPVSAVVTVGVMMLYGSQMVYCFIFGTPYSVSQIGLGADAVTSFWREMLQSMLDNLVWLLGLPIPFVLLNLWGLEYDSRLLSGTDIFSDSLHMAVLSDRSFLTDLVWFNPNRGEIRYQVDESLVPEGYVDSLNNLISTRFELAREIVKNDYYDILFPESG